MDFTQKQMAMKTWFTFEDRELHYRARDNSGEVAFSVDYEAVPANSRRVFNRNNWLRNVGVLWCVIGVIQIGLALASGAIGPGAAFWFVIGAGCLAFYRLTWSEYTVFDTPHGPLFVINDKNHDAIVAAIDEKRKAGLLAWYHSLDFSDEPAAEAQTVEWLMKQDVLTKAEGEARLAELREESTILLGSSDSKPGPQIH
jgi:hypothetical protein